MTTKTNVLPADGKKHGTKMKLIRRPSPDLTRTSLVSVDVPKSAGLPSERRLDEEAVSRMDDEGGANNPAMNPPGIATKAAPGS